MKRETGNAKVGKEVRKHAGKINKKEELGRG